MLNLPETAGMSKLPGLIRQLGLPFPNIACSRPDPAKKLVSLEDIASWERVARAYLMFILRVHNSLVPLDQQVSEVSKQTATGPV